MEPFSVPVSLTEYHAASLKIDMHLVRFWLKIIHICTYMNFTQMHLATGLSQDPLGSLHRSLDP